MEFNFKPQVSVGPIEFGVEREQIRQTLNSPYEEFLKTLDAKVPTDDFLIYSLHVFYSEDLKCKGVEFLPGSNFPGMMFI